MAEQIWICENGTVTKWEGDILDYKQHLKKKLDKAVKQQEAAAKK